MTSAHLPKPRARLLVAALVAVAAAVWVLHARRGWTDPRHSQSDFDQVWFAARALLAHRDPYTLIGPGRAFDWPWPFFYPLTAALLVAPLAALPVAWAHATFVGLSSGALAYALTSDGYARLPVFASAAFVKVAVLGQWGALLTAAAILPWLGLALACKPTIGAALWTARPSRRAIAAGAALGLLSLAVLPRWPVEWLAAVRTSTHFRAPVQAFGGAAVLLVPLALTRWRRPEARALAALACVPQTAGVAECLPLLALVPSSGPQSLALAALSYVPLAFGPGGGATLDERVVASLPYIVGLVYVPCLALILRRPNVTVAPGWIEQRASALLAGDRRANRALVAACRGVARRLARRAS